MKIETALNEFCNYSEYIKGYTKSTIKRYRQITLFFAKEYNLASMREIDRPTVRNLFLEGRLNRGWKPNTFIVYHKTLNVFFRWCVDQGYMETNYAEDIECPKLGKQLPKKLSRTDAEKLIEIISNYPYDYRFLRYRNRAIFATFLYAGLRKSELLSLKLTDIDLENRSIFVSQGKGMKDRIIPINTRLGQILERYLKDRKRLGKTCPEFFASLNRDKGFTASGLKHLIRQFKKRTGIDFSAHKLRHTFATLMLEGGCDIYSLSRLLGHSDIKTTTIYLSATAEHLRGQIAKHPLDC